MKIVQDNIIAPLDKIYLRVQSFPPMRRRSTLRVFGAVVSIAMANMF
ncbi:MAG: hypothetical protein RSB10_05605 [Clostridia bacterium]